MASKKRKADDDEAPNKRVKQFETIAIDEEEDVAAIWAQIQSQERASGFRAESHSIPGGSKFEDDRTEQSDYSDQDVSDIWAQIKAQEEAHTAVESDEQLARRLEAEWQAEAEKERNNSLNMEKNTSLPSAHLGKTWADAEHLDPLQTISEYIQLFTRQRVCPNCEGSIPSRRGFVSI